MKIYCLVNSGRGTDWQHVMAMCEDGCVLAEHISSSEAWAQHDIGITSDSKHDRYREHCPDGYELVWVDNGLKHEGLAAAYAKNQERKTTEAAQ